MPDFDNFTAKLIAADKYSKYMTEIPILEGAAEGRTDNWGEVVTR